MSGIVELLCEGVETAGYIGGKSQGNTADTGIKPLFRALGIAFFPSVPEGASTMHLARRVDRMAAPAGHPVATARFAEILHR